MTEVEEVEDSEDSEDERVTHMAAVWGCTKAEAVAAMDHEGQHGWRWSMTQERDCTSLATQDAEDEQSRVE